MSKSIAQLKEQKHYDVAIMRERGLNLYYRPAKHLPAWFIQVMREANVPTAQQFQHICGRYSCIVTPNARPLEVAA